MLLDLIKKYLPYIIILAIGGAFGFYYAPEKVKTKIEYKEKIVEIEKEKIVEVNKRRTSTHIIMTEYPDGKKVTETFIIDESIELIEVEKEKIVYKDKVIVKEKEINKKKADWLVKASMQVLPYDSTIYTLDVNRRILGPIFLGASVNTKLDTNVGVGLEF